MQIQADTKIYKLAKDYVKMMDAVKDAQNDRKTALLYAEQFCKMDEINRNDSTEVNT